jgi:hypothetical protein
MTEYSAVKPCLCSSLRFRQNKCLDSHIAG